MGRPRGYTVFVLLPAYNEEVSLNDLLDRIKATTDGMSIHCQVVVVNDGSTDKTLEVAQRHSTSLPMQIINHDRNKGLGEALRTGLSSVRDMSRPEDVIITMDADNSHPPNLIPTMLDKIEDGNDLVVASRYVRGAREVGLSLRRKVLSRGASALLKILFPIRGLKDYTCGYRAYRAAMIDKAFAGYGEMFVQERGFAAIVEILLKLRRLNVTAAEVPLVLRYDQKVGASKMPILKTIMRYWTLIAHNLFTSGMKPL